MFITFAICTHNEGEYVGRLLKSLYSFISMTRDVRYEVVVVDDFSTDATTLRYLEEYEKKYSSFYRCSRHLDNDFASQKNFLNEQVHVETDWIIQLDADELLPDSLLRILPLIFDSNPDVEAYWVPRVNIVHGLTIKHVQEWKWTITKLDGFTSAQVDIDSDFYKLLKRFDLIIEQKYEDLRGDGIIVYHEPINCWPDYQCRIYKNSNKIQWEGKVHEQLTGFTHFTYLPQHPDYAIRHIKEITRQEDQNVRYATIVR